MNAKQPTGLSPDIDDAIKSLSASKTKWAQCSIETRIELLKEIKNHTAEVAASWVAEAAIKKQIPADSPLRGEEWISGPYTLLSACNALINTLSQMEGKQFLKHLPTRGTGDFTSKCNTSL